MMFSGRNKKIAVGVILIFLFVAGIVFLFVPLKTDFFCNNECESEGYEGGYCREVSTSPQAVEEMEREMNLEGIEDGTCTVGGYLARSFGSVRNCFCKKGE